MRNPEENSERSDDQHDAEDQQTQAVNDLRHKLPVVPRLQRRMQALIRQNPRDYSRLLFCEIPGRMYKNDFGGRVRQRVNIGIR